MLIRDQVQRAKRFIDENYSAIKSVEEVSFQLECNYHSLRAEFVRQFDITMNSYLNFVKCQKAKDYLKNTNWKLYKIALEVGFKNEKYFIRVFEKHYNSTPNYYRKHVK